MSWLESTAFADALPTRMNYRRDLTDSDGNQIANSQKVWNFYLYF